MKAKTKSHNKSYTILVVEDSPTQAVQVRRILEEEGFTAAVCRNGKEALSYLKERKPTIIISDIVMPEMDGYELCSTVKKDETLKDIPVILLTALTSPEDVIKGLQSGADNFITKPYEKEFLLSRIQYILANQEVRKRGTTEVGLNIYFMGQTHTITSNRMQIVDLLLSTYEHAVLQNQELKKTHAELETLNKQLEERVKQRTQRIESLNSVLRAIRGVNQLIVREKDRDRLITEACRILTTARESHNAWIALMDESGELVATAEAGVGQEFLRLKKLLKGGKLVNCARRALKKSEIIFIEAPFTECADCPLAKESHARGAMAVRLEHAGRTYGLLSISVPEELMTDKEELSLFKEVAGDISFGLHNMELEEKKKKSEEELRHERDFISRIMETSPVCITMVNSEGQITFANPGAEEVLGFTPDEVTGRAYNAPEWRITDYDGKPFPEEQLPFRQVMDTGLPVYDVRHALEWPDGRKVLLSINGAPLFDNGGKIEGVICTIQDVTERMRALEDLQESEKHYRTLFEQSRDAITLNKLDGRYIEVNQTYLNLFGYTPEEIMNLTTKDTYVNPDDRSRFKKEVEKTGLVQDYEARLRKKDGTVMDCLITSTVWREDDGSIISYQSVIRDITERKQAERALEEERNVLRTVINNVPHYIYVKDNESRYVISNNAHVRFLGAEKPEEVVGKTVFELFPQELADKYHADDQEVIGSGEPIINREEVSVNERGKKVWNLTSKVPLRDSFGKIIGIVGIARDITELKEAEEKIRDYSKNLEVMVEERTKELNRALYDTEQARNRIDGILKSVGDGLIVTDLYNRVVLMNRAAEDLLEIRLSEVIDRPIDFAIEDKTLRDRIKTTLDKRESGYQFDFEIPGDEPTNPHIIRGRTSIIEDKTGKHTGIITTMHDVTYEREVDRMKTEFISTAAHELRTPLTSIQGFSELLTTREDITEEEKRGCLSYINTQSVNLANIINDLLDISRIESGKGFSLDKAPCSIAELIRETVPSFQMQSEKHQFDLILPEEQIEVMADIDKMRQVFENILSNAVKYSPEGGTIRITGNVVEDHYQVSIEDQGIGMSMEQVEKIFDKFYRADASNTAIPGTGLGMSIVKYLVEAHGGEVFVESTQGSGTSVRFTIPLKSNAYK
jgi:PAS domain S-box-containing protein